MTFSSDSLWRDDVYPSVNNYPRHPPVTRCTDAHSIHTDKMERAIIIVGSCALPVYLPLYGYTVYIHIHVYACRATGCFLLQHYVATLTVITKELRWSIYCWEREKSRGRCTRDKRSMLRDCLITQSHVSYHEAL